MSTAERVAGSGGVRCIVLCGFLGSGKTSLVLALARSLVAAGARVAVVENEFSRSGVDDRVLAAAGLPVRQLLAGCVCCSLRQELRTTVAALIAEDVADTILVEASGVAGPRTLADALAGLAGLARPELLGVIDASRVEAITRINDHAVGGLLAAARVVVVSKCDLVPAAELPGILAGLAMLGPDNDLLPMVCSDQADPAVILAHLDAARAAPPLRSIEPAVEMLSLHRPAVAAAWTGEATADAVAAVLASLAGQVAVDGVVPGHLKGIVTTPGGSLMLSCTRSGPPDRRGLLDGAVPGRAVINAILCGPTAAGLAARLTSATAALTSVRAASGPAAGQ
jgi:G3E family GTPase